MFTILFTTVNGVHYEQNYDTIEDAKLAFKGGMINKYTHSIVMVSRLTGEVLYEWCAGKWGVFDGTILAL